MLKKNYKIILASASPRRRQLLKSLDIAFEVKTAQVDETFPNCFNSAADIPVFLAEKKAIPFQNNLTKDTILITADTIVFQKGEILGKPKDLKEAKNLLQKISGKIHQVISGVCLTSQNKQVTFYEVTQVTFKRLADLEINYYLQKYKPLDKAGAYGIQEWIGMIGVEKIEGCFYNVMGLPLAKLYEKLNSF